MGRSRLPLALNGDDSPADLAERFSAHYVAKITHLHARLTVASVPSHPPPADNNGCSVTEPLDDFQPATVEAISKLSMAASGKVCPRIRVTEVPYDYTRAGADSSGQLFYRVINCACRYETRDNHPTPKESRS